MTKHKLWYIPMSHEYGYAHAEFFTSEEDMIKFLDSLDGNEESLPIGRQPGNTFEFEINDKGEIVL